MSGLILEMKRWLAVRRWWFAAMTVTLVAVRIGIAVGVGPVVADVDGRADAVALVTAVLDVLVLGLAVFSLVAFVQYGRIFRARVPTE